MQKLHAIVTAYKDHLIFALLATGSIPNEVVSTLDKPGNFGQVLINTGKHLGVSNEALVLLKTVKRSHDAIGEVDWSSNVKGDTFAWLGHPHCIINIEDCGGSRNYAIGAHIVVPNESEQEAKDCIDEILLKGK